MAKWWWADYVDEHLTSQLAECGQWLKESKETHFVVDVIVPMDDTDGYWAAWLSLSPVSPARGGDIRVLVDSASTHFGAPLLMRRVDVRNYVNSEWIFSRESDPPGLVLRRRAGLSEWVLRSQAIAVPPERAPQPSHRDPMPLAQELCERHKGKELMYEPDGVARFVVAME